jgi:hypothetical protein
MSKLIVCSVLDHKTKRFGFLQTNAHLVDAERTFKDIFDRGDSMISKYPEDFSLYKLADYDSETGLISMCDPFVLITHARSFVPSSSSSNVDPRQQSLV